MVPRDLSKPNTFLPGCKTCPRTAGSGPSSGHGTAVGRWWCAMDVCAETLAEWGKWRRGVDGGNI